MIDGTRKTGLLGEIYASRYLRYHGYEILSANYFTKSGEIDLVASKNDVICFVEVKTRTNGAYFDPVEAVDANKEENVKSAAASYVAKHKLNQTTRFDIIEVIILDENKKEYKIRHNKNAF